MKENCINVKLKNDINEVTRILEVIDQFCTDNEISSESLFQISLAVDEILTNIISYGYKDDSEHIIEVDFKFVNNCLTTTITDDGIDFNPLNHQVKELAESLEEIKIGGLGIHLIRNYVNELKYERRENKNILTFTKIV